VKTPPYLAILLTIATLSSSISAEDRDWKSYFKYPDSRIVITIGSDTSRSVPYKNHSVPRNESEQPLFLGGFGTEGQRPDNPSVTWKFIQKTEYGDLYLFVIETGASFPRAIPALFTGSATELVYHRDNITVQIDPFDQ
jgi:hypothetical protein